MTRHIHLEQAMSASAERVFAALDDHANMGAWLGSRVSVVEAAPDGGVGTIRRIAAGPLKFDEQVVERDAPRKMVYRIVSGVPALRHHLGEITVEAVSDKASVVRWHVELDLKIPGASSLLAFAVGNTLERALSRLNAQLSS